MSLRTFAARFMSAHFYAQKKWSEEQNLQEFGRCHTPYGHGHNYRLEVGFQISDSSLTPDQENQLREAVRQEADILDHQHLNFVFPEFQDVIPTTENIALRIWRRLQGQNLPAPLASLKLFETDDLWVEVTP